MKDGREARKEALKNIKPTSKSKKVIKAWAVSTKKGKLKELTVYEGCQNCDFRSDGYVIVNDKKIADLFASTYMQDKVVPVTITINTK